MKYLSVCSGIEAASVAWRPLGFSPVAFSEIDASANRVLAHHFPTVPNWGNLYGYGEWPQTRVDVLVGGTPCQAFSVAHLQAGFRDPRGRLALVYLACVARYRPAVVVWENVPGCLSANEGRDFGAFVGALVELGYGCAWRVLDAQYFGVPQRRRRVFVVGCVGDWRRAGEILFEPDCLLRNPAPGREAWAGTAGTVADDTGTHSRVANTLSRQVNEGQYPNLILQPYSLMPMNSSKDFKARPTDVAQPLTARQSPERRQGGDIVVADPLVAREGKTYEHAGKNSRLRNVIAFDPTQITSDQNRSNPQPDAPAPTLAEQAKPPMIADRCSVRRLLPIECERLQGFPDGYTDLPGMSDTARYRMLGNSIAVPVLRWIGQRINRFAA